MSENTQHLQEVGGARGQLRPLVPGEPLKIAETVLKKRRHDEEARAERLEALRKYKRAKKLSLETNKVKSAQYFVKRAVTVIKDRKRLRVQRNRKAKEQRNPKVKIYCVVRNHRRGGCKETQAALKTLGLTVPYSCTFIPNDEAATKTLRKISPFVFYGLPSPDTVRRLFLAKGQIKGEEGGPPSCLSSNVLIEEAFGSLGILCIEDIISEVLACGPHFAEVMKRVGRFQLSSLKQVEGIEARRIEYGYLGHRINIKVTQLT